MEEGKVTTYTSGDCDTGLQPGDMLRKTASPAYEVSFQMFGTNGGWRAVESSAKVEMQSRETALILTWPPRSSIGYRGQCWQLVL